jgi:hypothetical protein
MAGGFFLLGDTISGALDLLGKDHNIDEVEQIAQSMLDDAKSNAPWNDRTGAARDGLDVDVSEEGDEVVVTLMHTVDYGIWLETIQSGRFAIIMPTLEKYASEIQKAVAGGMLPGG